MVGSLVPKATTQKLQQGSLPLEQHSARTFGRIVSAPNTKEWKGGRLEGRPCRYTPVLTDTTTDAILAQHQALHVADTSPVWGGAQRVPDTMCVGGGMLTQTCKA